MTKRRAAAVLTPVLLATACVLALASCFDPEPARISISCSLNGLQKACTVVLRSEDGNVERSVRTNIRGIGEFKHLLPGEYVLTFVDGRGTAWPAVRPVSLRSGEVKPLRVELTEAEPPQPRETDET